MAKDRFKIRRPPKLSSAVAERRKSTPLQTSTVSDTQTESEWVIDIENKLEEAQADEDHGTRAWPKVSIYRIPKYLRDIDKNIYTPHAVSLGPYHHGDERLSGMERHKWRALRHVLKRNGHRIERYLDAVKEIEVRARACYEGPVELSSYDFVEMLLLDSTFILEIFRGADQGFESLHYARSDPIFALHGGMTSIMRDMIMLENQIPLFVLNKIYGIQGGDGDVASLALSFFKKLVSTGEAPIDKELASTRAVLADQSGLHCLEVFQRSLLPEPKPKPKQEEPEPMPKPKQEEPEPQPPPPGCIKKWFHPRDKKREPTIHCVTELKEAGIKFEVKETNRICDIDFTDGVLKIPRLLVQDSTKFLFLNLIAFEQCRRDCTDNITSYLFFMDYLINSPDDVAYLHHCRIVDNNLGSNLEVAELFNHLCYEVVLFNSNDSCFSELTENINKYYDQPWNAWRASLMRNYFSSPWSIISFTAAIILVLLTFAQTFYAIFAYHVPPS